MAHLLFWLHSRMHCPTTQLLWGVSAQKQIISVFQLWQQLRKAVNQKLIFAVQPGQKALIVFFFFFCVLLELHVLCSHSAAPMEDAAFAQGIKPLVTISAHHALDWALIADCHYILLHCCLSVRWWVTCNLWSRNIINGSFIGHFGKRVYRLMCLKPCLVL